MPRPTVALAVAVALACLLGSAASQRTYYCNSTLVGNIVDADFYLVTRPQGQSSYPRNFRCTFDASTAGDSSYFVEILESDISAAQLTVRSSGQAELSTTSVSKFRSSLLTRGSSLEVEFQTISGSARLASGVRMRVRSVRRSACPPGWQLLNGTCYGSSDTSGRLDFEDAQLACNSMRANLLQLPRQFYSQLGSLLHQLPPQLTASYAWIGLTNIARQSDYLWLDGSQLYFGASIGCITSSCGSSQRCASAVYPSARTVYMASCYSQLPYICSMPTGGASSFYSVPRVYNPPSSSSSDSLQWWQVILIIIGGLIVLSCCGYGGYRKRAVIVSYVYY